MNQWHSCTDLSVEDHLADKTDLARELYYALETAVGDCGEFRIHAVATRIGFITRMSFAGATLKKNWIDVTFILPRWVDDTRFGRIVVFGVASYGYELRLHELSELDHDLRSWLCEAHRRGGAEPSELTEPVTVRACERGTADRFGTIIRGEVVAGEIAIPNWFVGALGPPPLPELTIAARSQRWTSPIVDGAAVLVPDNIELDGPADVTLGLVV